MTQYCPACANETTEFQSGAPDCELLLIEEFPEVVYTPKQSRGWFSKRDEWTPRKILENEMDKCGLSISNFRIVSVYPHAVPDDGMPNENCYNFGLEKAVEEINGRRGVIVLGTNLCETFTGFSLKKVMGLSGVESKYIPDEDIPRVFLPSIRTIYATGPGEFRLGMMRFAKQLGE